MRIEALRFVRWTLVVVSYFLFTSMCSMFLAGCSTNLPTNSEARLEISSESSRKTTAPRFTDVTLDSGVDVSYSSDHEAGHHSILQWLGGGVAIFDFDRDTNPDLIFAGGGEFRDQSVVGKPSHLFRNIGQFEYEIVRQAHTEQSGDFYSHGCHTADFDNDGFADVLITGYGGLSLLHNLGDGTFVKAGKASGLGDDSWSTSAAWGDLNSDGNLDLYIAHYVNWSFSNHPQCTGVGGELDVCPPKYFSALNDAVYISNGDGSFHDATSEVGLIAGGKGLGVVMADLDLDHDIDVYVANDTTENYLYLNSGLGKLEELGVLHGASGDSLGEVNGSMGVDVGDFDHDELPDIWVTNYVEEPFALYRNMGNGQFQHSSKVSGVNALGGLFVGFGTGFIDADCDGDSDLVTINGHVVQHPTTSSVYQLPLFLENQSGRFSRVENFTPNEYFAKEHVGRGLAWADLDEDGDIDLVATHLFEPAALLRNDTSSSHQWLRINLIGLASNRDAVGAWLLLHTSQGPRKMMIKSGGSYLSQADASAYWALPSDVNAKRLTVTWPSGRVSVIEPVPLNRTTRLLEPL